MSEFREVSEAVRENWLLQRWMYKEAIVDGLRTPLPGIQLSEATGMVRLTSYPGRPERLDKAVLMPVAAPPGYAAPESMASAAFLADRGMSSPRVRARDGRELFHSAPYPEPVERNRGQQDRATEEHTQWHSERSRV
ncbi:hypothetical protein [Streptomyces sp. NPDC059008]|uniref:hypothetical protein n=1 Tax=Streptomyces sp. NPDC059008 TaxID=3346693 RepID=UPI00368A3933